MEADYVQRKFIEALRTQNKSDLVAAIPCPYEGHHGRMFLTIDQLYDHAKMDHPRQIAGLEPTQARLQLKQELR
jgi:hypothetical protein